MSFHCPSLFDHGIVSLSPEEGRESKSPLLGCSPYSKPRSSGKNSLASANSSPSPCKGPSANSAPGAEEQGRTQRAFRTKLSPTCTRLAALSKCFSSSDRLEQRGRWIAIGRRAVRTKTAIS